MKLLKQIIPYLVIILATIWVFGHFQENSNSIIISLILCILWLTTLIYAWDKLVDGSSNIAYRLKIPAIVVWLTVVSFWTSAPELVVSMMAALNGSADISIANVVGSNIVNLLFILWVSAFIFPITVNKWTLRYEIPFSLIITFILFVLLNDVFFKSSLDTNILSRLDGLVLLALFAIFMYYIYRIIKIWWSNDVENEETPKTFWIPTSIFYIVLWIFGLYLWGNLTVWWASYIAKQMWVSELLIWATIVAIWTSLPELVASIIAAKKKQSDLAIWNVIWSNIFNILWILWATWVVTNINFNTKMTFDIILLMIITFILIVFSKFSKDNKLWKLFWVIFMLIYVLYTVFIIIRG